MKYSFYNDYSEGCHPRILEALTETNDEQTTGYGLGRFCEEARGLLRDELGDAQADVHFLSGGTQANIVVLGALLKPFESVIAPESGHICLHEAGAIEATGHKINTVPTADGKLVPAQIRDVVAVHSDEHMVRPRAVFISQSTELGTVYSKKELGALSEVCRELGLLLYLDGARLGSALTCASADMTLADVARLVDVFYIGGTKNGALLGEAIVVSNDSLKDDFRYHLKHRGALLAKGRVLGLQFKTLFEDKLFYELASHANAMAVRLAEGVKELGYVFMTEPVTNQVFPVLPNKVVAALEKEYGFYRWEASGDDKTVIRLVTSWATKEEMVEMFLEDLKKLS